MTAVDEQPRHPGGRPSKLTPDRADVILQAVEQGSYLKVAALSAGVHEATLHRWLANGSAAQTRVDAHDPDHLYCPTCDLDRTDDAREIEDDNARDREPDDNSYAVLGPCPDCRSTADPVLFALTPDEEAYREFREQVTRAEATAETVLVAAWASAASGPDGDWRAARDLLARRAPERWAGVTRVQMTTEETERRLDDAVTEALTMLNLGRLDDEDDDGLPREVDQ